MMELFFLVLVCVIYLVGFCFLWRYVLMVLRGGCVILSSFWLRFVYVAFFLD